MSYTYSKNPTVNQKIGKIVNTIAYKLNERNLLTNGCFLLCGGYGKSEGGVRVINGKDDIANNLDFVFVYTGQRNESKMKKISIFLKAVERKMKISIDFSDLNLKRHQSNSSLFSYDLQEGHKFVCGNNDVYKQFIATRKDEIDPRDIQNLMVNRGVLLLLNDEILKNRSDHYEATDFDEIMKFASKAIIGLGDALLFAKGKYHWSYVEKLHRMRELEGHEDLVELYQIASTYRFCYDWRSLKISSPISFHRRVGAIYYKSYNEIFNLINNIIDQKDDDPIRFAKRNARMIINSIRYPSLIPNERINSQFKKFLFKEKGIRNELKNKFLKSWATFRDPSSFILRGVA
jgi:hypothetical protein